MGHVSEKLWSDFVQLIVSKIEIMQSAQRTQRSAAKVRLRQETVSCTEKIEVGRFGQQARRGIKTATSIKEKITQLSAGTQQIVGNGSHMFADIQHCHAGVVGTIEQSKIPVDWSGGIPILTSRSRALVGICKDADSLHFWRCGPRDSMVAFVKIRAQKTGRRRTWHMTNGCIRWQMYQ